MPNILETIINHKKQELIKREKTIPLAKLVKKLKNNQLKPNNFLSNLLNHSTGDIGLIAEIKLASPSAGRLGDRKNIIKRALTYQKAGADVLSIITDNKFFNGQTSFITKVKNRSSLPILQKDFVIDPYQLYEAKLAGADAILLIAQIIKAEKLTELVSLAQNLGLEPVIEVASKKELKTTLLTSATCIGINARNLKDFSLDIKKACQLGKLIPRSKVFLGLSGIKSRTDVEQYQRAGAKAILVGTSLMQSKNIKKLIKKLKNI